MYFGLRTCTASGAQSRLLGHTIDVILHENHGDCNEKNRDVGGKDGGRCGSLSDEEQHVKNNMTPM